MSVNSDKLHKIYGKKTRRINYQAGDFIDYAIQISLCGFIVYSTYGAYHWILYPGSFICAFLVITFPLRNGIAIKMPVLLKRPTEIIYSFLHKIEGVSFIYVIAVSILFLENYLIYLTPDLPHQTELMKKIAIWTFWIHYASLSAYRTIIFIHHLVKKEHVRMVLMESVWKNLLLRQKSITLHLWHAYFTGELNHLILIAPCFLIITHLKFSILFFPVVLVLNGLTYWKFLEKMNELFYREHWLGHNLELDFLYYHGPHHDAIPSSLIGTSTGFLEGFLRNVISFPNPFFQPVLAIIIYSIEMKYDMDAHQFIPGVFPEQRRALLEVTQHSRHHYGKVEPFGLAINYESSNPSEYLRKRFRLMPEKFKKSALLDEQLNGFKWANKEQKWFLSLADKYSSKNPKKGYL